MDTNQIRNLFRVGRVSSVNGTACTARVTFPDKEELVSAELPVLQIGSLGTRGYWVPEINTQVLCAFLPNPSGKGINQGFILGAFYSTQDRPAEQNPAIKSITFPDGSRIRYEGGVIEISAASAIKITAPRVDIN